MGVTAALLIAVLAFSAWNKQRASQTLAPVATQRGFDRADLPKAKAPKPKPAVGQTTSNPRDVTRDRPERDRIDRPGDKQWPPLEEYRTKVLQEFRSGDRDDDGYLSRGEVRGRFAGIEREFERVDSDGDGRVSPEEFWRLRRFQAQQKFRKQ